MYLDGGGPKTVFWGVILSRQHVKFPSKAIWTFFGFKKECCLGDREQFSCFPRFRFFEIQIYLIAMTENNQFLCVFFF